MFSKIIGVVLSGVLVAGGIFGVSQLDRSYKGYDATELLISLKEIYNEDFEICNIDSSNGCIDHYHNFYTICGVNDASSRFSFESISDADKKDKLMLSNVTEPCYAVAKASNVKNKELNEKLGVIDIIPETISMLFGTEYNIEDIKSGKYLSEPVSYKNSVKNAEYCATYLYPLEYDKDAALREVVTNLEESGLNKYRITIAFVTNEEYQMFNSQFEKFEYVYVRDEQYGISTRNCVFSLGKDENTIGLYNVNTSENYDISGWVE